MKKALFSVLCALLAAAPAQAGEIFGGLYAHDVDTFLTKSGIEGGADIQLGYRWDRIGRTRLRPYAFAAANTAGETHYAAADDDRLHEGGHSARSIDASSRRRIG